MTPEPDFNRFWEQVFLFLICQRLQIVFDIATDERFSAQAFGLWSATARLRGIAKILAWSGKEPLIVAPPSEEKGH